jgi:hypothetical protein
MGNHLRELLGAVRKEVPEMMGQTQFWWWALLGVVAFFSPELASATNAKIPNWVRGVGVLAFSLNVVWQAHKRIVDTKQREVALLTRGVGATYRALCDARAVSQTLLDRAAKVGSLWPPQGVAERAGWHTDFIAFTKALDQRLCPLLLPDEREEVRRPTELPHDCGFKGAAALFLQEPVVELCKLHHVIVRLARQYGERLPLQQTSRISAPTST